MKRSWRESISEAGHNADILVREYLRRFSRYFSSLFLLHFRTLSHNPLRLSTYSVTELTQGIMGPVAASGHRGTKGEY